MALTRRYHQPTFKRPPAPNWNRGLQQAMAALYATDPVPADEIARLERECAQVPYCKTQSELPLDLPEAKRR